MALKDVIVRRRKDTGFILGVLGFLLVALTGLFYLLQTAREIPANLATNRVLLSALLSINVILILVIVFVLARNLFKLVIERRDRILGSKFKSKLVATYIGLSLVPVVVLFFYAAGFLQIATERWIAQPVGELVQKGSNVADTTLRMVEDTTLRDARLVARDLEVLPADQPELIARLRRHQQALALDFVAIYRNGEFLQGLVDPASGFVDLPEPPPGLLAEARSAQTAVRIHQALDAVPRFVLAAATVLGPDADTVVVAGRLLSLETARQSEELILAYQAYRQQEILRAEITASQLLMFLMITLLLLLATSWVGLYLARRVTVPILALADGTRRIADGDLTHRVDVDADDELAILVESFNRMTGQLEGSTRDLRSANRRLGNERTLFATVLQNVAAGVIAVDEQGEVFLCNQAALAMLIQSEADLRGHSLRDAWRDPERRKLVSAVEGSGARWDEGTEVRLVLAGTWKTIEVHVTAMHDEDGAELGQVIVLEDLTDLIKAQQLAAWSDAARRIAHEIKNPLTPIQLAAERVLRRHEQGAEIGPVLREGVEIIVKEVDTLKSMVGEFSRFARMPRPQPSEVDLGSMLSELAKLYRGIKDGVDVEVDLAPDARAVWADGEQLKSALINLMDNAIAAVQPPGSVTVTSGRVGDRLQISVSDTGHGIPPDAKEKIFLPHFSTKGRGTGLGLAIVHRVVTDHHGTIAVHDNDPRGTTFTIELRSA